MAVRDDFAAGEVLAAADLNDTFASKLPYSYGTATPSTTDSGFLWYDSNSTPAATKFWDGSAFVPFGGKILQIVRATDGTDRTTSSTSFVDASLSVTITPQKNDSAILLVAQGRLQTANNGYGVLAISDNSNNLISGGEASTTGDGSSTAMVTNPVVIAYATPATTSATTYKLRFRSTTGTVTLGNSIATGQMYALEISA